MFYNQKPLLSFKLIWYLQINWKKYFTQSIAKYISSIYRNQYEAGKLLWEVYEYIDFIR